MTPRLYLLKLCAAIVFLCTILPPLPLAAQHGTNRGREFWVAFIPNFGAGSEEEVSALRLYVSCDDAMEIAVTYMESGETKPFMIDAPYSVIEIDINALFGDSCELHDVIATAGKNGISSRSFHIEAPVELTLIGADIRMKSADAFLGLPVEALGREYLVLAYPSSIEGLAGGSGLSTPSQFAVVATEENTTLDITPIAGLKMNGGEGKRFTIQLARGEVFLGQADLNRQHDVTGTRIVSNKPVAVFAGHKRTGVPISARNYRDYLVEQLPPLESWGREIVMTPQASSSPESGADVRILAAHPTTGVQVLQQRGTTNAYMLDAGGSVEFPVAQGAVIMANQPILTALYHRSTTREDIDATLGDPFMSIGIPSNQFCRDYTFMSIPNKEFMRHYADLIVPAEATGILYLDGHPLSGNFLPIPYSRYSHAQISLSPGGHRITCDSAFGLYAFGFGNASSYGYPGGFDFDAKSTGVTPPAPPSPMILSSSPNPVSGSRATLDLLLSRRESVSVSLLDLAGRSLRTIADAVMMEAGTHRIETDLSGLPNGNYFYRVATGRGQMNVVRVVVER